VNDRFALCELLGIHNDTGVVQQHAGWIKTALAKGEISARTLEDTGPGGLAREFLEAIKFSPGSRARYRGIEQQNRVLAPRKTGGA